MDSFWLNAAFYQASHALGRTENNPAVGCVLVNKNQIVGVGATSKKGRPHAEENAIRMAGNMVKGATMYITLEPCNLENNNFSCTKQIIKNGIKKVVIGALDPNPLTLKKGYEELNLNGIEVVLKKVSLQNFLLNYSQLCIHLKKRPMIALKMAVSLDGNIFNLKKNNKWITSKFSRLHVHQIRSLFDGILIGTNTMIVDNPSLNIRINGYKQYNKRIVFDKFLKIDFKSNLLKNVKKNPLIIFTSKVKNKLKYNKLLSLGVKIHEINLDLKNNLSIKSFIQAIQNYGIKSILLEGGAKIASSFLNNKSIDIIYLYRSNKFIGKDSINVIDEIKNIDDFELYNKVALEKDQLEIWINKSINKLYS
jgi:diaminohydroxyphosphoribosylaminopyrimidine deaminase/5-amino-6-(5-phosphoribosylamino)uracil reductase